jgi:hypothetical protein
MRSPTCLLESRVYSSKNLRSTVQKGFYCNDALDEIERRRAVLGVPLRQTVREIEDAEFNDQTPGPPTTLGNVRERALSEAMIPASGQSFSQTSLGPVQSQDRCEVIRAFDQV